MVKGNRIWIVVGAAAVLLLVVVVGVPMLLNADNYRGRIEAALSTSLGRPVQLGHLDASVFTGSLVASTASIADDPTFSKEPFLTAKDIRIGVEMVPLLLHHQLNITGLTIDQPKIQLIRAQDGTWNYSSLGGEHKPAAAGSQPNNLLPNLTVGHLDIKNGTVTTDKLPSDGHARVYSDLNLSAQDFSFVKAFPYTVTGKLPGDGSVKISGQAGPVNPKDASLTPVSAQIALKHVDLAAAGVVSSEQGISGLLDLDAAVSSDGQAAKVDGQLHLSQLKLAKNGTPSTQPVECQFLVNQDLRALSGQINSASVQIGKAALGISGDYKQHGDVTTLALRAEGQQMPINELVAFLPSLGVQLPPNSRLQGGTLTLTLNITGPTTAPVIDGPVRIVNTQLAGFDLGQKMSSVEALMGAKTGATTTIQAMSTDLHYGPDGIRTNNLAAVVAGLGSASGNGTISPAGALDYHLVVKLGNTGVAAAATQAIGLLSGAFGSVISQTTRNGIPVAIGGTTANPTFRPEIGKMLGGTTQKSGQPANPLGQVLGGLLGR